MAHLNRCVTSIIEIDDYMYLFLTCVSIIQVNRSLEPRQRAGNVNDGK